MKTQTTANVRMGGNIDADPFLKQFTSDSTLESEWWRLSDMTSLKSFVILFAIHGKASRDGRSWWNKRILTQQRVTVAIDDSLAERMLRRRIGEESLLME